MHYLKCSVQVTVWLEFQKTYLDLQCWISSVRLSLEIPITLHVMAQLQDTMSIDIIDRDEQNQKESQDTDFEKACREGNLDAVESLLVKANFQMIYNGLVLACRNKRRNIIKAIIKKDGIEYLRDSNTNKKLFLKLVENEHDVAYKVLDECYEFEEGGKKIKFDYIFLEERAPQPRTKSQRGYSSLDSFTATTEEQEEHVPQPKKMSQRSLRRQESYTTTTEEQLHLLAVMDSESKLLLHPVVKSLLSWKWSRYIALFFFINLLLYLIFLSFLTAFALNVPNPQLSICTGNGSNGTDESGATVCGFSQHRRRFLILAAVITSFFSILRIMLEVCELFNLHKILQKILQTLCKCTDCEITEERNKSSCIKWIFFTLPSNYVEVPMYFLSIAFVAVIHRECLCPSPLQWQAGTVAVLLAWVDLILFLNKWPALGIYIGMLRKITLRFLKVSIIAFLLLFTFGLGFYMVFYEPDLPTSQFQNPIVTFMTMISFTIDGPDISIFRLSNDNTKVYTNPYPVVAYLSWITFALIMSILFLNFLVGLAVDDVKELKKQADEQRIRLMINLFKCVEEVVKIMRMFFKLVGCNCCLELLQKRSPKSRSRTVTCDSFFVKMAILWGDGIHCIICQARKEKELAEAFFKSETHRV